MTDGLGLAMPEGAIDAVGAKIRELLAEIAEHEAEVAKHEEQLDDLYSRVDSGKTTLDLLAEMSGETVPEDLVLALKGYGKKPQRQTKPKRSKRTPSVDMFAEMLRDHPEGIQRKDLLAAFVARWGQPGWAHPKVAIHTTGNRAIERGVARVDAEGRYFAVAVDGTDAAADQAEMSSAAA